MKSVAAATLALLVVSVSRIGLGAEPLPPPAGPVILTLSGNIAVTNAASAANFDRAMLQAVGWRTVATFTRWTEGLQKFEGVPLGALLARVGAGGERVVAVALNDYKVVVPVKEATHAGLLLAMKRNGEWMSVRDKGPIWIVYPGVSSAAALTDSQAVRMVWQLRELRLE